MLLGNVKCLVEALSTPLYCDSTLYIYIDGASMLVSLHMNFKWPFLLGDPPLIPPLLCPARPYHIKLSRFNFPIIAL